MSMFKEVLYETHREVDLMLINCDKRDFITRAELTIMKCNLDALINMAKMHERIKTQLCKRGRTGRTR